MAKILLLEDDSNLAGVICMIFEDDGHEIVHVDNFNDGKTAIEQNVFDLVITDTAYPIVNGGRIVFTSGFDFAEHLWLLDINIPVLAMSGEENFAQKWKDKGYPFILKKGNIRPILLNEVKKLLAFRPAPPSQPARQATP